MCVRIGSCNTKSQALDYWLTICFFWWKIHVSIDPQKKCSKIQKQSFPTLQKLSKSVQGARRTVYPDFVKNSQKLSKKVKNSQIKNNASHFLGPLKKNIAIWSRPWSRPYTQGKIEWFFKIYKMQFTHPVYGRDHLHKGKLNIYNVSFKMKFAHLEYGRDHLHKGKFNFCEFLPPEADFFFATPKQFIL